MKQTSSNSASASNSSAKPSSKRAQSHAALLTLLSPNKPVKPVAKPSSASKKSQSATRSSSRNAQNVDMKQKAVKQEIIDIDMTQTTDSNTPEIIDNDMPPILLPEQDSPTKDDGSQSTTATVSQCFDCVTHKKRTTTRKTIAANSKDICPMHGVLR